MNIDRVTITGADDAVDIQDLAELSMVYPFVEWGILCSIRKTGTERYPKRDWINKLAAKSGVDLSAHFCGWFASEVLENQKFSLIDSLPECFKRIQLNYNFAYAKHDLRPLLMYARETPERCIILQENKTNSHVLNSFRIDTLPDNIHFLYDSSGGRGKEIEHIQPPFKNYTGYAGGISLENIDNIFQKTGIHANPYNCWIDMESGVRTDNKFDLEKVKAILETSGKWIKH